MILVTGASGFVGSALVRRLSGPECQLPVVFALRKAGSLRWPDGVKPIQLFNWTPPISVDEGLRRAALGLLK